MKRLPPISTRPDTLFPYTALFRSRPRRMTVTYDMGTGREASREGFADGHVIDRVVGYGIAWHEGQLFGWVNQLVGVLTAIGLIMMAVSEFILWRRRKPGDVLGAPPPANIPARIGGVAVILLTLAALLPLLAASLLRSEEHTSELQAL